MKAIVYHKYGSADVLKYEDIPTPVPKDNEILIKVRAASVNPLDWRLMNGEPKAVRIIARLLGLKIGRLGVDVAGEVEAVGRNITQFKPGDRVFGGCRGAFAEYACTRERSVAMLPANVTFEQGAAVNVAGLTALQGLRDKGKIRAGQKVLINGASGGVGTFAVQIAKILGAEVTGVCSTRNVAMVKSIGADGVIDYTREDFTKLPQRYDVILDCVGNKSLAECRGVLKPNGKHLMVGATHEPSMISLLVPLIKALVSSPFMTRKAIPVLGKVSQNDLSVLGELIASGKLTPVIDKRYSLTDVSDAMRYAEEGHVRGKVIVEVNSGTGE